MARGFDAEGVLGEAGLGGRVVGNWFNVEFGAGGECDDDDDGDGDGDGEDRWDTYGDGNGDGEWKWEYGVVVSDGGSGLRGGLFWGVVGVGVVVVFGM
ncbi:hypothetical protein QBC41DRAFT_304835 [Cercophora samala]|uniref:Uncharacterized protein n=1 Tax=Cercophora samala TaxID=330535 RepID=A0AA40D8D9_9PEZI|nr:hypothetical protein QBC41DRAFT_304835 [Cercophora samala]